MFIRTMAHTAIALVFAIACASCAAEHLETRDPARGPAATQASTTPVVRPTDLQATEKQIGTTPDHAGAQPASPDASHKTSPDKKPVYVCPMHPEVRSDKPGACPKCGMKLELHEHGQ